jgi:hypothetical protein
MLDDDLNWKTDRSASTFSNAPTRFLPIVTEYVLEDVCLALQHLG